MKAQFFIISSVVIASVLFSVAQTIVDYSRMDPRVGGNFPDLFYLKEVKKALYSVPASSTCERLRDDLNDTAEFLRDRMLWSGINLTVRYDVLSCSSVVFNVTGTSAFARFDLRFSYP